MQRKKPDLSMLSKAERETKEQRPIMNILQMLDINSVARTECVSQSLRTSVHQFHLLNHKAFLPKAFPEKKLDQFINVKVFAGGLTNSTIRVELEHKHYVSRKVGVGSGKFIDRHSEKHNVAIAVKLGITPPVIYHDEEGNQIVQFIHGKTMDAKSIAEPENLRKVMEIFNIMSDSPYPFVPQGNILGEILEKCERLGEKRELFLALFMQYLAPIKELLSQQEIEMAPCHIDPNFGNFIKEYGTGKMYLLDLEYGRHFDPMWDLADLSCEAKFSAEKDQEMLSMKKGITLKDRLRFVLYKPVVEFYWALWAEEQIANGNQLDKIAELRKHCQRIENFKRMVASPEVREAFVALSRMTKPVMTELDVHTIAPPERRCSPR